MTKWSWLIVSIVIFLLVSPISQAQETIVKNNTTTTACGIKAGKVDAFDGSICPDDEVFNILTNAFPSIFSQIAPILKLDYFKIPTEKPSDMPGLLSWSFLGIAYSLTQTLVMYVFIAYIGLVVITATLRATSTIPIEDSRGGQNDTIYTWSIGGASGGLMMVPIQNGLFLGPAIMFCLSVVSVSIANSFSSGFLSIQQGMVDGLAPASEIAKGDPSIKGKIDRQQYLADNYVRYLVKMEICRSETNSLIVSRLMPTWESPQDAKSDLACLSTKGISASTQSDTSGDVRIDYVERPALTSSKWRYQDGTLLNFGLSVPKTSQCDRVNEVVSAYSCGELDFGEANAGQNPLLSLLDNPLLIDDALDGLARGMSSDLAPGEVQKRVYDGWNSVHKVITDILQSAAVNSLSLDDVSTQEKEKRNLLITQGNTDVVRQLSRYYHQSAMNIVMFGRANQRFDGDESTPSAGINAVASFVGIQEKVRSLAVVGRRLECVRQLSSLAGSSALASYIQGGGASLPQSASSRCLDVDSGRVLEWDESVGIAPDDMQSYTEKRTALLRAKFSQEWKDLTSLIAARRQSVERSFVMSVDKLEPVDWWAQLRHRGFISMGNFPSLYSKYVEGYKQDLRMLNNNYDIGASYYDGRYLAQGVAGSMPVDPLFVNALNVDQQMMIARPSGVILDPLVDRRHWLAQQEQLLRQPTISNGEIFDINELIGSLQAPVESMRRLGVSSLGERSLSACVTDASKCPLPVSDPLVELSLMGHDMVNTGLAFYAMAAGLKSIQVIQSRPDNPASGTINKRSAADGLLKKSSAVSGVIGDAVSSFINVFDIVYGLLGSVMGLYIAIGAILAYVIPALPTIYLNLVFISWFMVVFMTTISVFLWSVMWVRFREHRDLIKKAGIRYGVELLFRPALGVAAVLSSGFLFYMSVSVATISMGWMNQMPLNGEGGAGLRSLTDPLVMVVLIFGVFGILLKQSYSYMDSFINDVLSRLGGQKTPEHDKMSDLMKAVLFDGVRGKVKDLHDNLSNDKERAQLRQRAHRAGHVISQANSATDGSQ